MRDDADAPLLADCELLRRAVENVVHNAIRYTPEGATVDVRAERAGELVRISVRDSGRGVPEELLPKIFQTVFHLVGGPCPAFLSRRFHSKPRPRWLRFSQVNFSPRP